MGNEWSEAGIGPQGPAGAPGGSYTESLIGASGTRYNGSALAYISSARVSANPLLGGFRYRITAQVPVQSTVANDAAEVCIRAGLVLGVSPIIASCRVPMPQAGFQYLASFWGVYEYMGADAAVSFGVTCERVVGSGTVTVQPTTNVPLLMELQTLNAPSWASF